MMYRISSCLVAVGMLSVISSIAQAAQVVIVNATVNSIGYSSSSGLVYGSIPNSSATNPNTLLPMNPLLGTSGAAIPIGFDPQQIAVSYDGSNVYTIVDGSRAVQRYDVGTQTADQFFTINGGPEFNAIYAIPSRPNAVLMHSFTPGQSPPDGVNTIYENAVPLPNSWAGPDIVSVDPTNGTRGFGYVNSNTGFGSSLAKIGPTGIDGTSGSQLGGVLTSFGINQVVLVGDRLFTNQGAIYSVSLGVQIGAFQGAGNFVVDPTQGKFFSITTSGSTETIHAYSLNTLAPVGTDTVTGVSGSPFSLIRFGANGLAFATTSGEVVFVRSQLVPEPATITLALSGVLCVAGICARQRCKRAT